MASKDTEFLALEVAGSLTVQEGARVNARNELRVTEKGSVNLAGGSLLSERWVEVQAGGKLTGQGQIHATFYNSGLLVLDPDNPLLVHGPVHLSGSLRVENAKIKRGLDEFVVLKAESIEGKFTNSTVSFKGKSYSIEYSPGEITLLAQ